MPQPTSAGYLAPYDIPGIQSVLHPRNRPPVQPSFINIPNIAPGTLAPRGPLKYPDYSGKYGGIYADSSWDIDRNWSIDRKAKIRGLQKATTARDLGQIDITEGFFHRLFGERGTTTFEMETSGERQKLLELIGAVTRAMPNMAPERAMAAGMALSNASRLAATYPDTAADLTRWRSDYAQVTLELKDYLPTNWASIALGTAGVAVGLYALYHFGVLKKLGFKL